MKIERVEVRELALPLRHPFETSFGRTTRRSSCSWRCPPDGVTGYGECVADRDPYYLPETNGTVWHVLDEFLVPLLHRWRSDPRDVWPGLRRVRGHEMAKAALEMAVWELVGAARGRAALPCPRRREEVGRGRRVGRLAGGRGRPRCARSRRRSRPATAASRSRSSPATTSRWCAPCARASGRVPLMVDANSAYTLDDVAVLRELDQFGLMMIEQPLAGATSWTTPPCRASCGRPSASTSRSAPGRRPPRARPRRLPRHQHQGRPRGRVRVEPGRARPLPRPRHARLVRRDAGVRHRPPGQRAPADAARLLASRRHLGQRALLRGRPRGPPGGRLAGRPHHRAATAPGSATRSCGRAWRGPPSAAGSGLHNGGAA